MQLSFWVQDMNESGAVKTDILVALDRAFKENISKFLFPSRICIFVPSTLNTANEPFE
jgi:hypothetical protein